MTRRTPLRRCGPWFLGPLLILLTALPASAVTGWTGPLVVGSLGGCGDVAAAIDDTGGYHVVANCGEGIRYASNVGGTWSSTTFLPFRDTGALDPRIAIDGNRVYVAFSRQSFATCGIDYLGVYYRWRSLPNGKWSAAAHLGRAGDSLQSFRVVDGKLHATVGSEGILYYEIYAGGTLKRYPLSDAVGSSSLRVSNDGTARIAYETAHSLRYASFNGSSFDTSSIPGTTGDDRSPVLVLDAQDHAHVTWSHTGGPGCGGRGPEAVDGTYYATNQSGSWTPRAERRITADLGTTSLTVDTATRRVHLLVAGAFGVKYYTKTPTGSWRGQRLLSSFASGAAIRLDATNGKLLVVYAAFVPSGHIDYLIKP
jgi:hypothetical protein